MTTHAHLLARTCPSCPPDDPRTPVARIGAQSLCARCALAPPRHLRGAS